MRDAGLRPEAGKVDDGHGRDLRPCPGGRRQRDDGQDRAGHGGAAADRGVDVVEQLAAVGREERAELRRVERRAAADAEEAVVALPRRRTGLGDRDLARLTGDAVVDGRFDAHGLERRLQALDEPGSANEGVADDERPRDAELRDVLSRLLRRARAEDDARGVEAECGRGLAHVRPALVAAPTTAPIASSIETTSPYFASMSSSEPSWASGALSATPSRGTSTR